MVKVLSFPYGDTTISFHPQYSTRRQTVEIAVEAPGKVIVTAPSEQSDEDLIAVVSRKAYWITQQLYKLQSVRFQPVNRELVNGESLLYLGRNYRLDLCLDEDMRKPFIILDHGHFRIITRSTDQAYLKPYLIAWYREKAKEKISARIRYFAPKLHVTPTIVNIKDQKKRWGSCTQSGILIFNWRCILAPSPVLDYIVVHELCHLIEKKHSASFWSLVRAAIPTYETRKRWLWENGVKMDV